MGEKSTTLEDVFDPKSNSLNAIRLGLALAVIVSHSWAIGGFGPEPEAGGTRLGTWAVLGFFGISGYLITRSRFSGQSVINYYRGRVLRIFPAFIVCLFFMAFVLAPLSLVFDPQGSWRVIDSISYFIRNLPLYPTYLMQFSIGDTLQHVPYRGVWNGSMWTLFWEAVCYALLGIGGTLLSRSALRRAVIAAFLICTVISFAGAVGLIPLPDLLVRVLPLFIVFAAGSMLFLFADRVPVRPLTVAVAAGALAAAIAFGVVQSLGALPLAFLVMLLGQALPLNRVGSRYDISYGVYIYAWPVQQYVFLVGGNDVPLPAVILISVAVTVFLAYISCRFIEKPALLLKKPTSDLPASAAPAI